MSMSAAEAAAFLRSEGEPVARIDEALGGFDFAKPVYMQVLEEGERLYQYMRTHGHAGNWFALKGATMDTLAIFGGNEGRVLKLVEITRTCRALEGEACELPREWGWAGGGKGGGTQLYLPSRHLLPCIRVIGLVRHA